jgi:putative ABC transport system ATP-binding protein
VAIARALINDPVLVPADAPTSNLDSRTGVEIVAIFQRLNRQGMTVVLVTHESDIARFARPVLQFRDGRIVADNPIAHPTDATALLPSLLIEVER